jgi:hypothetical protein
MQATPWPRMMIILNPPPPPPGCQTTENIQRYRNQSERSSCKSVSRSCYIKIKPKMPTSQNGLGFIQLSLHKKNIQNITKNFVNYSTFIFYHCCCETRLVYDTFVLLFKHCFVMQPLQNPPICGRTVSRSR